jgi:hypothetical protein
MGHICDRVKPNLEIVLDGVPNDDSVLEQIRRLLLNNGERLSLAAVHILGPYARPLRPVVPHLLLLLDVLVHQHVALVIHDAHPAMPHLISTECLTSWQCASCGFTWSIH